MKTLTAADLRLGLDNLYTAPERYDLFQKTAAFVVYGAALDSVRVDLPLMLKGNRPLAKELNIADHFHDDLGAALLLFTDAIKTYPSAPAALKQKAERIQTHFIPNLSALRVKYKKEAQNSKANRPKLIEMEADLKSIPTPDGRTAYDWVVDFLDSGDKLGELIDARSKAEAVEPGPELILARTHALATLTKARSLVADEAERTSKLPKNAEAILFGYFDTLAAFRTNEKADDHESPPAATVPPPAEGP